MESITPSSIQFQKSLQSVDNKNEKQFAESIEKKKLLDACKDFEAILLNKMLSSMRESIPEGGLFEKSYGEKIYQSMLDEEMTKEWAHGKGMGIGELLYKQLSRTIKPSAGEDGQK
ncbi:MAG: rod-binding protein [Desulfobulbaceae bacterium]|nr:rod-binding protein [Desulfobulbaceae bacterium]